MTDHTKAFIVIVDVLSLWSYIKSIKLNIRDNGSPWVIPYLKQHTILLALLWFTSCLRCRIHYNYTSDMITTDWSYIPVQRHVPKQRKTDNFIVLMTETHHESLKTIETTLLVMYTVIIIINYKNFPAYTNCDITMLLLWYTIATEILSMPLCCLCVASVLPLCSSSALIDLFAVIWQLNSVLYDSVFTFCQIKICFSCTLQAV